MGAAGVPVKVGDDNGAAPVTSATGILALAVKAVVPDPFTYPVNVVAPVPPLATGNIPVIFVADTVAIFASVTFASNIFEVVIFPSAIFEVVIFASKTLLVVTALFAIVNTVAPVTSPVCVAFDINPLYKLFGALSPVLVPDKFATALFANIALVMAAFAIDVAFPKLVTTPVKFALVVTVAALPPMFKFATGVVDVTISGAVPVATVDVIDPLTFKLVPVAAPIFGVTKVGEVFITKVVPVPV